MKFLKSYFGLLFVAGVISAPVVSHAQSPKVCPDSLVEIAAAASRESLAEEIPESFTLEEIHNRFQQEGVKFSPGESFKVVKRAFVGTRIEPDNRGVLGEAVRTANKYDTDIIVSPEALRANQAAGLFCKEFKPDSRRQIVISNQMAWSGEIDSTFRHELTHAALAYLFRTGALSDGLTSLNVSIVNENVEESTGYEYYLPAEEILTFAASIHSRLDKIFSRLPADKIADLVSEFEKLRLEIDLVKMIQNRLLTELPESDFLDSKTSRFKFLGALPREPYIALYFQIDPKQTVRFLVKESDIVQSSARWWNLGWKRKKSIERALWHTAHSQILSLKKIILRRSQAIDDLSRLLESNDVRSLIAAMKSFVAIGLPELPPEIENDIFSDFGRQEMETPIRTSDLTELTDDYVSKSQMKEDLPVALATLIRAQSSGMLSRNQVKNEWFPRFKKAQNAFEFMLVLRDLAKMAKPN